MKVKLASLFSEFFESEKTGGLVLVCCTAASILISNSPLGDSYLSLWQYPLDLPLPGGSLNLRVADWINDGLMTVFFLLVGLEIERELYIGQLSGIKNTLLPVFAALGGMVVPALVHLSLNAGAPTQPGFGIPMATDIAFSLATLSLLGKRVPTSLKVLLTGLAIIDDLGAVAVIAFFYAHGFSVFHFAIVVAIFAALVTLNRLKTDNLLVYTVGGVCLWFFMLKSGVHATVAGVLLAFAIPFRKGDKNSPSYRVQHFLDKPVPFVVLPLFALANTGIVFSPGWYEGLIDRNTVGIVLGLVLGKPGGIAAFSLVGLKAGLCRLPDGLHPRHLVGMGMLAGIGFTMSIFTANLAFADDWLVQNSKIAILSASAIAGGAGYLFLAFRAKGRTPSEGG